MRFTCVPDMNEPILQVHSHSLPLDCRGRCDSRAKVRLPVRFVVARRMYSISKTLATTGWQLTNSPLLKVNKRSVWTCCCSSSTYLLGVIDLKNPTEPETTIWSSSQLLQIYSSGETLHAPCYNKPLGSNKNWLEAGGSSRIAGSAWSPSPMTRARA